MNYKDFEEQILLNSDNNTNNRIIKIATAGIIEQKIRRTMFTKQEKMRLLALQEKLNGITAIYETSPFELRSQFQSNLEGFYHLLAVHNEVFELIKNHLYRQGESYDSSDCALLVLRHAYLDTILSIVDAMNKVDMRVVKTDDQTEIYNIDIIAYMNDVAICISLAFSYIQIAQNESLVNLLSHTVKLGLLTDHKIKMLDDEVNHSFNQVHEPFVKALVMGAEVMAITAIKDALEQ